MIDEKPISFTRLFLVDAVKKAISECPIHSQAFALRICDEQLALETGLATVLDKLTEDEIYGGYPDVASLGYKLSINNGDSEELANRFFDGIKRQRNRPNKALGALALDDIALLGCAEGVDILKKKGGSLEINEIQGWLLDLIDQEPRRKIWSSRLRDLAGDILDKRGRLRVVSSSDEISSDALEIVLRNFWPQYFIGIEHLNVEIYKKTFTGLLKYAYTKIEQVEEITVWLKTMDLLLEKESDALFLKSDNEKLFLSMLENIKRKLDLIARKNAFLQLLWSLLVIAVAWVAFYLIKQALPSEIQEYLDLAVTILLFVGGYLYYAVTLKQINPKEIFSQLWQKHKLKMYEKVGFDIEKFKEL